MLLSKANNLKPPVTPDQMLRRSGHSLLQTPEKIGTIDKLKSVLRNKTSNNNREPQKNEVKAKDKEEIVPIEVSNDCKDRKLSPKRLEFMKDLHIINFRSYVDVSFEVEGSSKLTQVVAIILTQLIDKLQFYNVLARIVKYKMEIRKCE